MKKALLWMLLLATTLACIQHAQAEDIVLLSAQGGDAPQAYPLSIAYCDDMLYILCTDGLYAWPGEGEARLASDLSETGDYILNTQALPEGVEIWQEELRSIQLLAGDANQLIGINPINGRWMRWNGDRFVPGGQLDWSSMWVEQQNEWVRRLILCPSLSGGTLYALIDAWDGRESRGYTLAAFDLETGSMLELAEGSIEAFVPMEDGAFMLLERNDEDTYRSVLNKWERGTDKRTQMAEMDGASAGLLCYDAGSQAVYYSEQRKIWRNQAGKASVVGYLRPNVLGGAISAALPESRLAVCDVSRDVVIYTLEENTLPPLALRVDHDDGPQVSAYKEAHPEALIEDVRIQWGSPESLLHFLTNDAALPDVFLWPTHGYHYPTLKARGYLADLGSNEWIRERTKTYYPFLREALEGPSGEIYAVPIELWVNAWMIDEAAWQELTGRPLPITFLDVLDAWSTWDNEDYRLIEMDFYTKDEWLYQILRYYNVQHFKSGVPLSFDNAYFRDTLKALFAMEEKPGSAHEDEDASAPKLSVIYTGCPPLGQRDGRKDARAEHRLTAAWITPPLVDPADQPRVFARTSAYVVNSATRQMDRAMGFIDYVARNDDELMPANIVMMSPEANDPILSRGYMLKEREYLASITDLESRLPGADADDAVRMRERIEEMRDELANDPDKWAATSEEIAQYRRIAPHLTFGDGIPVYDWDPVFQQLFDLAMRYLEGASPLEQTIEAMNHAMEDAFNEQIR